MNQNQRFRKKSVHQFEAVKKTLAIPDFKQAELFEIALTHPSYIYERIDITQTQKKQQEKEYRRLAHLGDAILGAIVTDYLYECFSDLTQGELTELKKSLVDKTRLFEFAQELQLKQFCLLGGSQQREAKTGQEKLFSEMFEALFGAIYLEFERNFSKARFWLVDRFIANAVNDLFDDDSDDDNNKFDEDDVPNTTVTTREYLDMIGLHDFPNYGWAPGDDD
jgi:dsRNA-specific ribonuclease